jgi:asparagine synthase (glutamine-hydrolysing)
MGVLMSGGLDSTSVACLAAKMIAPQPLTALSYVFDELPECDERKYINAMQEKWDIRSIQIPCDDLWPLKDWSSWPHNPNRPDSNLYRLLLEVTHQRAKQEGIRVLLTGAFGDELYSRSKEWLADFISEGRLLQAGRELAFYLHYAGFRWTFKQEYLQRVGSRAFHTVFGGRPLHSRKVAPAWLTSTATSSLFEANSRVQTSVRPQDNMVGLWKAMTSSSEIFYARRNTIEMRHPYRDRRLIDFALALPAYQLYHRGYYKHILRNAMKGLLPEVVRVRPKAASLDPFFRRGMQRGKIVQEDCFLRPGTAWRNFVDEKWISTRWNAVSEEDDLGGLVPWSCIAYEAWHQHFISDGKSEVQ